MKIDRTIKQTYDYDKFHKIKGNRDVNSTQVKQLIKSIEEGWVPNPAHVNENMGRASMRLLESTGTDVTGDLPNG